MEKFYNYLRMKYFINYEDEEIKDISKAMEFVLGKLQHTFNITSEVLRITKLVPCGSMQEKTTVRGEESTAIEFEPHTAIETIEFDCLAVLDHIVPDMEIEPSCPGYMRISSKTLNDLLEEKTRIEQSESYQQAFQDHSKDVMATLRNLLLSDDPSVVDKWSPQEKKPITFDMFVSEQIKKKLESGENTTFYKDLLRLHKFVSGSSKSVSTEFMINIDSAAEELCRSSEADGNKKEIHVSVYKVDMPTGVLEYERCLPGCQLAFAWKSKLKPTNDKIVYADFVPAFQVYGGSMAKDSDLPNFLVAKSCRSPGCEAGCWRLSHCLAEIKAIQETKQSHRDVYKIFKIFNHNRLSRRLDNALKSYHIKTALLEHIFSCQQTAEDITYCLCKTLDIVNKYADSEAVPHWKDPNYSLALNLNTCHRIVPLLLQFIFDTAVRQAPVRLFLTVSCEIGRGGVTKWFKAGSKLSSLVCEIIEGKDRCESLVREISETLEQAADLAPLYHQHSLRYSFIVQNKNSRSVAHDASDAVTIYHRRENV